MKINPRREAGTVAFYVLGIVFGVALFALGIVNVIVDKERGMLAVSSIVIAVLVIVMVSANLAVVKYSYDETNNELTIQTGFSKETFRLKDVTRIEEVSTFFPQGTLAKKKIKIDFNRRLPKDRALHTVYMAVENQKEFIQFLRGRAHSAKFITEAMSKRKVTKTTRYK